MNVEFTQLIKKNLPMLKQPKRAQIYVGFQCNQKCGFCYYKPRCNEKMFEIDYIKKQIDFEYEYGIRDFEITGGEPSEFKQLREVCEYIKTKDSKSKIAIITNGHLWKRNIWNVIDEVLISYHLSKNPITYDRCMFPLGSTYANVLKTINKAKESNILVRTNTVLGTFNIGDFDNIVNDLIEFSPSMINFLPVNLFDYAEKMSQFIDYNILRPLLKNSIDKLKKYINAHIAIRYFPLCEMEGYEKYILGQLQHIYDWFDWNRELDGTELLTLVDNYQQSLDKLGRYGSSSLDVALYTRKHFYQKNTKCLKCKYQIICDGVEKTNDDSLFKYISPSKGKIITNILEFIGNSSEQLYNNIYG